MCRVINIRHRTGSADEIYIGRGSKWGNPFRIGSDGDRAEVIARYREYLENSHKLVASLHELKGKTLVCHCKPKACHGDVLKEKVDG